MKGSGHAERELPSSTLWWLPKKKKKKTVFNCYFPLRLKEKPKIQPKAVFSKNVNPGMHLDQF